MDQISEQKATPEIILIISQPLIKVTICSNYWFCSQSNKFKQVCFVSIGLIKKHYFIFELNDFFFNLQTGSRLVPLIISLETCKDFFDFEFIELESFENGIWTNQSSP